MTETRLSAVRVGALLVSASCGVAFLLGSGEMAVHSGVAGSLYAVVTAAGMLALGMIAPKLWHAGEPIWDVFGNLYGAAVRNIVALLSLVWMSGVLAAQIHGSVAVISTVGLPASSALVITAVALMAISFIDLGTAASFFAVCLLASNLALLHALVESGGLSVYLHAWPSFIREIRGAPPIETVATAIAIGFLVVTGSDYQQFVIAAHRPGDAWRGCMLASVFLSVVGFLPAATVVAALRAGNLSNLADYADAIPWIMLHSSATIGPVCLGVIVLAALGSGTAITRAMTTALMDLHPVVTGHTVACRFLAIVIGCFLAIDGQTIISTIVSLNMVYISAVGVLFVMGQTGRRVAPHRAVAMMALGSVSSLFFAAIHWMHIGAVPGWLSLPAGLIASTCPLLAQYFRSGARRVRS
jgi:solute:Na+ symporter, SSS family